MASKFQVISFAEEDVAQVKEYRRRKPHHKTRSGCIPCKVKRVKCDQARPCCARCRRNARDCSYDPGTGGHDDLQQLPRPQKGWALSLSRTLRAPETDVDELGPQRGTSRAFLLHHFGQAWRHIFDVPRLPVPIHSLHDTNPCLQRTLLAISASHLRHLTHDTASHRVAEAFQQSAALAGFRALLAQPMAEMAPSVIDSLLVTAMLLNMLFFALPPDEDAAPAAAITVGDGSGDSDLAVADPARSWVFSTRTDRLTWLALLTGLRPLLLATRPYREGTMLGPVLDKSDQRDFFVASQDNGLEAVPEDWLAVFGIRRGSRTCPPEGELDGHEFERLDLDAQNQYLFREPLRLLADIVDMEPLRNNIFQYVEVIGKLEREFRQLLYERDERTMWILGFWMGLMCRFDGLWWCDRRVRRDYVAIGQWFQYLKPDERPGEEGRLWASLMADFHRAPNWPQTEVSVLSEEFESA